MLKAPLLPDEEQRLKSLRHYCMLDTPPEVEYDRISQIASQLCQAPIALVSLIDRDRQWVKACHGLKIDFGPRDTSICGHTILDSRPLIIEDTTKDKRFWDNPSVTGQPFVIFYAGVPLMSSDGHAIGSICVIDHQPRQLAPAQQLALEALAEQVMLLMELRRTNLQLDQARAEAETLARQKANLLATLSHEIRTPLHALEGYTQLLIDEPNGPDQQNSLKRLQTTSRTLVRLVNNILDYSKLQAGKLILEAIPFSLTELLQQTLDMQLWQAQHKNIQLTTQLDDKLPDRVKGDATRLLQVLLNLLSNALKFTEAGEVCIQVRVLSRKFSAVTLQIDVVDTGIGIPQASLASLFNEYTQVSAATSRLYGGSGLGLSITRQLLALMGSELVVESKEGVGSRFGFSLALPVVEITSAEPTVQILPDDVFLAVDDNPFNTTVLAHFLSKYGGQVAVFESPLEALESAKTTAYRAMLLDLHMPELDGYALARQMQVLQPDVTLIAMSADDSVETVERVKSNGFRFFLRKPFLPYELEYILTQLN